MTPQTPATEAERFTDPLRPDELRAALDRKERECARHAKRQRAGNARRAPRWATA